MDDGILHLKTQPRATKWVHPHGGNEALISIPSFALGFWCVKWVVMQVHSPSKSDPSCLWGYWHSWCCWLWLPDWQVQWALGRRMVVGHITGLERFSIPKHSIQLSLRTTKFVGLCFIQRHRCENWGQLAKRWSTNNEDWRPKKKLS